MPRSCRHLLVLWILLALLLPAAQALAESTAQRFEALENELRIVGDGFENAWIKDDVQLATRLFDLEARSLEHLRRIGEREPGPQRDADLANALALSQRIFQLNQELWERGIEKIQIATPGEPDPILTGKRVDKYQPLDRKGPRRPGGPDVRAALEEARQTSSARGEPLSRSFIDSLPEFARLTWVRSGTEITVSSDPTAKHLLLSRGQEQNGAGDSLIIKNSHGEILLAVVQHTSGTFKSGPGSTELMRQVLISELNVPTNRVATTFSRPGSAGLISLLLRARGIDGDVADRRQATLEDRAARYRLERRDLGRPMGGQARRTDLARLRRAGQRSRRGRGEVGVRTKSRRKGGTARKARGKVR